MCAGASSKAWNIAVALVLAGLTLCWSLPHSIAGRNIGLAILLFLVLASWRAAPDHGVIRAGRRRSASVALGATLFVLTVWLAAQPWIIGLDWAESEFRSQWFVPVAFALCGYVVASRSVDAGQTQWLARFLLVLVVVLAAVTAVNTANVLWGWLGGAVPDAPERPWLYDSAYQYKLFASQLANSLLLLVACDGLSRWLHGRAVLPVSGKVLTAFWLLAVGGVVTSFARNGLAVALVTTAAVLALTALRPSNGSRRGAAIGALLVLLIGLGIVGGATQYGRWQTMWAGFSHAWQNFDTELSWLGNPGRSSSLAADVRGDGDASAYERLTYLLVGTTLIREAPLGHGFRRTAFVEALEQRFGPGHYLQAHSGLVEFGVGAGLPGLVLLGLLFAQLSWLGVKAWTRDGSWAGAALAVLVLAFTARGLVDNTLRNQFGEMAFFLGGLLFGTLPRFGIASRTQDRQMARPIGPPVPHEELPS